MNWKKEEGELQNAENFSATAHLRCVRELTYHFSEFVFCMCYIAFTYIGLSLFFCLFHLFPSYSQALDLDDWLSEDDDSDGTSGSDEEENEAEIGAEDIVRWSTLALTEEQKVSAEEAAVKAQTTPAQLVAKCRENASRRQKIQMLRLAQPKETEQKPIHKGTAESRTGENTGDNAQKTSTSNNSNNKPQEEAAVEDEKVRLTEHSESDEDEMENLLKKAATVQVNNALKPKQFSRNNKINKNGLPQTCIRFSPMFQRDLELSGSSR